MSLEQTSRQELEDTSMLEVAHEILMEEQKAMDFNDLYDRVADLKGFNEDKKNSHIAQFHADLTVDGRFLTAGQDLWGLKRWYPVEHMDEVAATTAKKKESKKKQQKQKKAKESAPQEASETREPDTPDDGVEVLTGQFAEEVIHEEDEFGERSGSDDGFDDPEKLVEEDEDIEEDEDDERSDDDDQ